MDSSCLIDLHKAHLLPCCLALSWQFIVPYPVRHEELLDFTEQDWMMMETKGLQTWELAPNQVMKVAERKRQHRRLSLIDCACLVLVHGILASPRNQGAITSTGMIKPTMRKCLLISQVNVECRYPLDTGEYPESAPDTLG